MVAGKVGSDTEKPGAGVVAAEVVAPPGAKCRAKCLANEIFGVASADPLGQIPVYLPCMSFEQGREGVRIGEGCGYLLSVGRLSVVTLVSVPHLTESCPPAGIRFHPPKRPHRCPVRPRS